MEKDIHVLFLDDEPNILTSIQRAFIDSSFGIMTTTNAKEAMEILDRERIKVVLSDYRMPKVSGIQFLNAVKGKHPDVIRVLFTGCAELLSAEEAINVGGVYRFLSKPWSPEELRATVEHAIQHFDLLTENHRLLSEMKRKNMELEKLNRQMNNIYETQKEFISALTNKLRRPLASIKHMIDFSLNESSNISAEDQKKSLQRAKNDMDTLNYLVDYIQDMSKLEMDELES